MNKNIFLGLIISLLALTSCNRDVVNEPFTEQNFRKPSAKEVSMEKFTGILSKATYEREDVRDFLKKEAIAQFDKNYDVFYPLVKGKNIGGETFRNILISYSSEVEIEEIEKNVPFLNILIPKIAFFDVNPEDLDTTDKEIPVAISKNRVMALYLNGKKDFEVEKGQIPNFHTFVVNENTRVIPIEDLNPQAGVGVQENITGINGSSYAFKSPNYDGTKANIQPFSVVKKDPGQRAIDAYKYFYKNDGSINQKSLQRDYIYYGITPQNREGSLNRYVSEYLSFIEVSPSLYFRISDQIGTGSQNDDPYIKEWETNEYKRGLSLKELIGRMWSSGSYNFVFEITRSNNDETISVRIPLRPDEIWDFNIQHRRQHGSFWKRSRNFYWINPADFTSKRVNLSDRNASLGKWNLSEESLYRFVDVYEEDEVGIKKTYSRTYESVRVSSSKFSGDIKTDIGLGWTDSNGNGSVNIKESGGASVSDSESTTFRETITVTAERYEASDHLGRVKIYFYEPIIDHKSGDQYIMNYYYAGGVKFGISVR